MRKKLHLLILVGLSINLTLGKNGNKTKHHNHEQLKSKPRNDRTKRSLHDDSLPYIDENRPGNRDPNNYLIKYSDNDEVNSKINNKIEKDLPFWGTRGRRDSSSEEDALEIKYSATPKYYDQSCKHCNEDPEKLNSKLFAFKNRRDEETSPFWGHRGKKINAIQKYDESPFWGNRGRRQEDDQFWATRGRRQEDEPFWGNRGRREDEPFWGNRGRREESAFWGSRGRRDDNEPFWGNRGRREETEPFWGNQGRRKEDSDPFWENRGRIKQDLKESITVAMNGVEDDIEKLSRLRRGGDKTGNSFWVNRGRDSKLKFLFNGSSKSREQTNAFSYKPWHKTSKNFEPNTVLDNRMFAEEPHYILVERSSRSSGEDDPYFITRGKKKFLSFDLAKAARDRRGSIEQIVKSVRNDPYYIARGKKSDAIKISNSTVLRNELGKAKELICATIDIIMIKNENNKVKREADENDRDRRTILKKLAAQLQNDPFFVSRGKKSDNSTDAEPLETFINVISEMCH